MTKRPRPNRLNDLDPKTWIKFQKSWFVHNPPPRTRSVLRHPAKFPETLAQEFIEFFTKQGQIVFDPMVGTGSTLVAALRAGRHSYGIELNPVYADIAAQLVEAELATRADSSTAYAASVIVGDAMNLAQIITENCIPAIDYVLTSPPYWNMLHARGAATQNKRRSASVLDVVYSENPNDLGNIADYPEFLNNLVKIYASLKPFLANKAYLTIIVKNIKKGGKIYPLAWDLAQRLGEIYSLKDERIWCQDDIRLSPYGLGSAWVSNTFHHYCLQFRNDSPGVFKPTEAEST
jgi:DNA modification methylase